MADELNDENTAYNESLLIGATLQNYEYESCMILINNYFLPV